MLEAQKMRDAEDGEKAQADLEARKQRTEEIKASLLAKTPMGSSLNKPKIVNASTGKVKTKKSEAQLKKGGTLNSLIAKYAAAEGVPLKLAHAVIRVESNYRVKARGRVGEVGLMQIKLATARLMGYKGGAKALYNPATNLKWGMKYLGKARKIAKGNTCGTILRYNAGHGAKRMNKVSSKYCGRVKRIMRG